MNYYANANTVSVVLVLCLFSGIAFAGDAGVGLGELSVSESVTTDEVYRTSKVGQRWVGWSHYAKLSGKITVDVFYGSAGIPTGLWLYRIGDKSIEVIWDDVGRIAVIRCFDGGKSLAVIDDSVPGRHPAMLNDEYETMMKLIVAAQPDGSFPPIPEEALQARVR